MFRKAVESEKELVHKKERPPSDMINSEGNLVTDSEVIKDMALESNEEILKKNHGRTIGCKICQRKAVCKSVETSKDKQYSSMKYAKFE